MTAAQAALDRDLDGGNWHWSSSAAAIKVGLKAR
jgi:hypothetical protein